MLIIGGLAFLSVVCVLGSRRLMHGKVREGHNDVCVPAFLNAGVLYAVLLGFMVVAVWESYDAAKATVSSESSAMIPLYRAACNLPEPAGGIIRKMVRSYIEAVVTDEWPVQASEGKSSLKANEKMGSLFRTLGTKAILSDEVKKDYSLSVNVLTAQVQSLSSLRNKRTIQASEGIPLVMWIVISAGAVIVIFLNSVIYMERGVPHVITAGALGALMGMLLNACLLLSHPFSGPMAITPESFEATLHTLDSIDKGN